MTTYQDQLTKILEDLVVHTANEYGGFEGFEEEGARDGLNAAQAAINALNAEHWLPKPIAVVEARIDELRMTLIMKGKLLVHGVLIDHTQVEGANPDAIDSEVVTARLKSLKAKLAAQQKEKQL